MLDPLVFKKFALLRECRKTIAKEDGMPAYAIFTDEEMAKVAALEDLNEKTMQSVEGIGEKKQNAMANGS